MERPATRSSASNPSTLSPPTAGHKPKKNRPKRVEEIRGRAPHENITDSVEHIEMPPMGRGELDSKMERLFEILRVPKPGRIVGVEDLMPADVPLFEQVAVALQIASFGEHKDELKKLLADITGLYSSETADDFLLNSVVRAVHGGVGIFELVGQFFPKNLEKPVAPDADAAQAQVAPARASEILRVLLSRQPDEALAEKVLSIIKDMPEISLPPLGSIPVSFDVLLNEVILTPPLDRTDWNEDDDKALAQITAKRKTEPVQVPPTIDAIPQRADPLEQLAELAESVRPGVKTRPIETLENLLAAAQKKTPSDTLRFAKLVTQILADTNYCIKMPTGEISKRITTDRNGILFIPFTNRGASGFKNAQWELVPYRRQKRPHSSPS